MSAPIVEVGTIEHEGRRYSAGGSFIDTKHGVICGYPKHGDPSKGLPHTLQSWGGESIGMLEITGHARGFHGVKLTCYALTYEGRRYHGRGTESVFITLRCTAR